MNNEQKHVRDLLRKVRGLLATFADKSLKDKGSCRKTGIRTKYNKTHRNIVSFSFHTTDKISVLIGYDVSQASDEYHKNMVDGVSSYLQEKRIEREIAESATAGNK